MSKGITSRIRRILEDWNTISDVMDEIGDSASRDTVMQTISRMKSNGEVDAREELLIGRVVKSYRISKNLASN